MAKQKGTLQWEVLSEAEWNQRNAPRERPADAVKPVVQARRLRALHLGIATIVVLLLIGSGATIVWRQAQAGLERIDAELTLAVEADAWRTSSESNVQNKADDEAATPLILSKQEDYASPTGWDVINKLDSTPNKDDPRYYLAGPPTPVVKIVGIYEPEIGEVKIDEVELKELLLGLAMVDVTTVAATGHRYRETQFYRDDAGRGWQRTAPDANLWGPKRTLATKHLHWEYQERDAAAVAEVAQAIVQPYLQLRHDVGLRPPSSTEKLIIEVRAIPLDSSTQEFVENRVVISSPLLVIAPVEMSQAQVLYAHALLQLIQHTLHLAQREQPVWCIWRPLLVGFARWQLHTNGASFIGEDAMPRQSTPALAELLESRRNCLERPVTQLTASDSDPTSTVMAESLFAYIVERYGREAIPVLFITFRHYSTWENAIPAAFATSMKKFEADWQAYVSRQPTKGAKPTAPYP